MARYVRVASISFGGTGRADTPEETVRNNLERMTKLLKKAAMDKPDIVCFPECSPTLGLIGEEHVKAAEEIPGEIFQTISNLARRYRMYIVCPMMEKKNGKAYNSAVLIDRKGEYLGSYHKMTQP
ncbi:MAG: carbon-nitrogen hydrolase family protein [Candidatus Bathyarchaeia archaeon]